MPSTTKNDKALTAGVVVAAILLFIVFVVLIACLNAAILYFILAVILNVNISFVQCLGIGLLLSFVASFFKSVNTK